jgi:hypothetical protein
LASIIVFEIGLPSIVVGTRVTGASDREAIVAYYGHSSLHIFGLLGLATVIGFIVFVGAMREVLVRREPATLWANIGFAFAIVAASLLVMRAASQMALVSTLAAGGDVLAAFFTMDFLYNAGLYAMEAGYPLAFGLAFAAWHGTPRWYLPLAALVSALQIVNMTSLVVGLPDTATLPGNIAFAVWFGATAWLAGRVGVEWRVAPPVASAA